MDPLQAGPVHDVAPGDHACMLFSSDEERVAAASVFAKSGLERGERVVYVTDSSDARPLLVGLGGAGIDVDRALGRRDLVVAETRDTYLLGGTFDPDRMMRFCEDEALSVTEEGLNGLRMAGEMSWALGGHPGSERLLEYEMRVNRLFRRHPVTALCLYDRRLFSKELVDSIALAHPIIVTSDGAMANPGYLGA